MISFVVSLIEIAILFSYKQLRYEKNSYFRLRCMTMSDNEWALFVDKFLVTIYCVGLFPTCLWINFKYKWIFSMVKCCVVNTKKYIHSFLSS